MTHRLERTFGRRRVNALVVLALLAGSVACIVVAPTLMSDSYSVVVNEVSEAGSQGVEHAWVTHLGFLLLGIGVFLLAGAADRIWAAWARLMHRVFGVAMVLTAVFSDKPWQDVSYDVVEDLMHSVAGGFVGAAFIVGLFIVTLDRRPWPVRVFERTAILLALAVPLIMLLANAISGAAERVMFAIAYVWYGLEAIRLIRVDTGFLDDPLGESAGSHRAWPRVPSSKTANPGPGSRTTLSDHESDHHIRPREEAMVADERPVRDRITRRSIARAALVLLAASVVAIAVAPGVMPDSYSIVQHAVSESAAQGVEHAWVARLGFLLLGFGVLLLAEVVDGAWGVWGRVAHRVYGVSIITAAAFSHMPWEDVPYDAFEDLLHSVAASGLGAAFTIGVLLVTFRSRPVASRVFDWFAIVAAVVIPMTMFNVDGIAGLVQRIMFAIGYLWYAMEARRVLALDHETEDGSTIEARSRVPAS